MNRLYLKLIQWLCRKILKKIEDKHYHSREELILYHDLTAIQCIGSGRISRSKNRLFGICLSTSEMLEADGYRDEIL